MLTGLLIVNLVNQLRAIRLESHFVFIMIFRGLNLTWSTMWGLGQLASIMGVKCITKYTDCN